MTLSRVIGDARKAGFENISIDLIYGLPGQTIAQWQDTLDKASSPRSTSLFRVLAYCRAENGFL